MRKRNNVIYIHSLLVVSIIFGLLTLLIILDFSHNKDNWKTYVSFVSLFLLASYLLLSYFYFKTPYLFCSGYILPLSIFHLGITIPDSFNILLNFGWGENKFNKWIELSGWYVILSISMIILGWCIACLLNTKRKRPINPRRFASNKRILYLDGVYLLALSILFILYAYATLGDLTRYSRVDFFRGIGDTRGIGLFLMTFPSCIILITLGAANKKQKMISYLVAIVGISILLLSGYRSAALFPVLAGLILWNKTRNRIPKYITVSIFIITIIIIPATGYLRSIGPYRNINAESISTAVEKSTVNETMRTMGQTGGILAHILKLVPKEDPYRYGNSYLDAVRNSAPNLSLTTRKSTRKETKESGLNKTNIVRNLSPSEWLTYRIAYQKFLNGEGVGFSAIGEAHLNYGVLFVVIFFMLLGLILGKLDSMDIRNHPNIVFFGATMYWPLMRSVRNDFSTFVKPAVFMLIFIIIWRLLKHYIYKPVRNNQRGYRQR